MRVSQESDKEQATTHKARAQLFWEAMDENEKTAVRIGMFPHGTMVQAEKEGFNTHEICVALMECASRNGGMRA